MAVVLLAALGPPARAEDPTSSPDHTPAAQPPPDAATQLPAAPADSDLSGESDPAPDEPAADAAGGWTLHLEALVSDPTSSAISPSQGPPPPLPAPVADRGRDTRQATPAPRGPAAPNPLAGAADQATSQPATTSLLGQAEQLAHQLDLAAVGGEDDPHTPTQLALAMPTDRGDGPRRDRPPGPDRSGRLDNPTAPAQPLPVPSASLPERIRAARRAIQGRGTFTPEVLQAWREEALLLQPQVAGSPDDATTVDNLLDRISRQLRRLSRPPDAAAAAAAVPVAQPLPAPSASLTDRIRAADQAIRITGIYFPQTLRAWHLEALQLQPRAAGGPDAAIVNDLQQRIWDRLSSRALATTADTAAAAQPLPNPSASLPERIDAAHEAIRSQGAYHPQILQAWYQEAQRLQPQVAGSPDDTATVDNLRQRVLLRLPYQALADMVAAAQPLPDPSALPADRVLAAHEAIRSPGAYPPEILQAWHQEALRLQQLQRQVGADRADINTVRNLYQRAWSRLKPPPDAASDSAGSSTSQMRIVDPLSPLPGFRVPASAEFTPLPGFRVPASAKFTPLPGFGLDDPAEFTQNPGGFRVPASAEFTPLPGFPLDPPDTGLLLSFATPPQPAATARSTAPEPPPESPTQEPTWLARLRQGAQLAGAVVAVGATILLYLYIRGMCGGGPLCPASIPPLTPNGHPTPTATLS